MKRVYQVSRMFSLVFRSIVSSEYDTVRGIEEKLKPSKQQSVIITQS